MKIIVCVDDNNGLSFNNRRQSRDKFLTLYLLNNFKPLKISPYSATLFKSQMVEYGNEIFSNVIFCTNESVCLNTTDEYVFVEKDFDFDKHGNEINELILCKWNRVYPNDKIMPSVSNVNPYLELSEIVELNGYSHDLITIEKYIDTRG